MQREIAYAKINLALHVRRRRDDGYHDIETVFAFCEAGDTLTAEPAARTSLTIDGPFAKDLSQQDNLVLEAANAIGITAKLQLTKNLPVASGIGGGSADAAAALRLLSVLSGKPHPSLSVQAALGADVPACVVSRTIRGTGVGDMLHPADDARGVPVLLVNPLIPLPTSAAFATWDGVDRGPLGDWRDGRNDLEPAARKIVPEIAGLLEALAVQTGAVIARMSGSGATCFALFDTIAQRNTAKLAMRSLFPDYWTMASVLR